MFPDNLGSKDSKIFTMNILAMPADANPHENPYLSIFTALLVCAVLLFYHQTRQRPTMPPFNQLFGRKGQRYANHNADADSTPSDPPETSQTCPELYSIRAGNRTLYNALSRPSRKHPDERFRPALAPELILQILSHPSRYICVEDVTFPPSDVNANNRSPTESHTPNAGDQRPEETTQLQIHPEVQSAVDRLRDDRLLVTQAQSPLPIIRTRALTEEEVRRIRRVTFEVVSHDQGWSSFHTTHQGTFEASWTWFEAVVRHAKPTSLPSSAAEAGLHQETSDKSTTALENQDADKEPSSKEAETHSNKEQRWDIQRNRHAGKEWERHQIEKDIDSDLVQSLRAGDVIGLDACAVFPGWQNFIQSARVEVWCVDDLSGELKEVRGAGGSMNNNVQAEEEAKE